MNETKNKQQKKSDRENARATNEYEGKFIFQNNAEKYSCSEMVNHMELLHFFLIQLKSHKNTKFQFV